MSRFPVSTCRIKPVPVAPSATGWTPYRVLLIDDDKHEREQMRAVLQQSSRFVVVGQAVDGPAGVALASALHPDLVVLDMSLPKGDGIITIRNIRVGSPASKVVVISGIVCHSLVHATVDIMEATSCLDKNMSPDRLMDAFLDVLGESGDLYLSVQGSTIDQKCVIDQRLITSGSVADPDGQAETLPHPRPRRRRPHENVEGTSSASVSSVEMACASAS